MGTVRGIGMYIVRTIDLMETGPNSEPHNTKKGRLGLRISEQQRSILVAASQAEGTTVSEFLLKHATRAAERVLADRRAFLLSEPQWAAFTEALDRPPRDLPKLREVLQAPTAFDADE